LRREADLAQKKRIQTRRRKALAMTERKLYPARSNKTHTAVDPTAAATATFLLRHRRTSATGDESEKGY
jgi:hypothetical protein